MVILGGPTRVRQYFLTWANIGHLRYAFWNQHSFFFSLRCFQSIKFGGFQAIEQDKASDASNKSLQRYIRLEVDDELVEIVSQCPYFASNYLA